MARGDISGSSRRCHQCKQRRKKCDLTEPSCLRCSRSGVKCSGLGQATIFINFGQESLPRQTQRRALKHAFNNRTALNDRRRVFALSLSRVQELQKAWHRRQLKTSLPGDHAILSSRATLLIPLHTALSEEFRPGRALYGGIFSGDRAPSEETKHYSSVALCIRSLLSLHAQSVPIWGSSIFSLLTLYYGRLHGDSGLIDMARSSDTSVLEQYQRHLGPLMTADRQSDGYKCALICASIALQFFEHVDQIEVFDPGHQAHIDGALKLLRYCGPALLQDFPAVRTVYSSVVAGATFLAIHRRQPNLLSELEWRHIAAASEQRSLREQIVELSLEIPPLLHAADDILARNGGNVDPAAVVDSSLHLLVDFDHLQTKLASWLGIVKAQIPGPLYWPKDQPTVVGTVAIDNECAPKHTNCLKQLCFTYGTIAGLLVQYWAFNLELLMTKIDLRRAILARSQSPYVNSMTTSSLDEDIAAADETANLICEAQGYLETCLEGLLCLQLPLKSASKYFQRLDASRS